MSRKSIAPTQQLLWGRAILYGWLTEAILIAVFIAGLAAGMTTGADTVVAVVGSFLLPLLFAMMLARRLQARFVLHGIVIGGAAFAMLVPRHSAKREGRPAAPAFAHLANDVRYGRKPAEGSGPSLL